MAGLGSRMPTHHSFVQRAKLFEGLDAASLETILAAATPRRVPKGGALFEQGDKPFWLALITEGRIKIGHVAPDGRTLAVGFLGPGEIAGCAAVFQRVPYPATARAIEDSGVLTWWIEEVEALVERYPKMATNAVRIVGARADAMLRRLQQLSTESVEQRIARALLRLASEAGRPVKGGVQVDFVLSRQDLAELSGATLYTVSRTLNVWQKDGVVECGRQRVVVRDFDRLAQLAEGVLTLAAQPP